LPVRCYPQAIAVAIALRHSWQPDQLTRLAKRLGIALSTNDLPVDRSTAPQTSVARTPTKRGRTRGHHRRDSVARLSPVKALRFAPTPFGASGLDRNFGRAKQRHLRDDPGDRPRKSRSSRS
jgi:hypothetical protein